MKRIICVLLMLLSMAAKSASSYELVTVPLPGIEGRYSFTEGNNYRDMHFELDGVPFVVNRVWIHISGVFSVGEIMCNDGTPAGPYLLPVEFLATTEDTINGSWFGAASTSSEESGAFEYLNQFRRLLGRPISWDFLMAGYGNLNMDINFGLIPECWVTVWPEATIETAELIIECDFPIAVDQSTWGSIKSLFR